MNTILATITLLILYHLFTSHQKQKRYNGLLIKYFLKGDRRITDKVIDEIPALDLVKLHSDILKKYNVQLLTEEEIIKIKNNE